MAKRKKQPAMTEAEWLACADPVPMVEFVRDSPRASPRVWRLFLAAFWGWQSHRFKTPEQQNDLRKRAELTGQWAETGKLPRGVTVYESDTLIFFNQNAFAAARQTTRAPRSWAKHGKAATAIQPHLLRDLFGPHPFRRVVADPNRLTSTVVALARGIYEERAFDRLPILADALQDAGCDDERLLDHCREGGIHVRGCWAVDLVLGKS